VSIRLNKLLAQRGLGARRKCDALVQSGAVRVNGAVVREPGTAVEPERDRIEVNGRPLPPRDSPSYYVLHKPVGVISTLSDPEGRRTLRDFLPPGRRVFPVGRLDADTSGLLILTNDGELAHHLMHPRYGVSKLYRVHTDRAPSPEMLRRLQEGIEFEPGVRSAPARVRVRDEAPGESVIELELHEGRYRQVRRMCEAAGLRVLRLHRWGYGPLRLAGLERGLWRELSEEEVRRLRAASARARPRPQGAGPRPMRGSPQKYGGGARGRAEDRPYGEASDRTRARPYVGGPQGPSRRGPPDARPYVESPARSRRHAPGARPFVGGAPGRSGQRSPDSRPYAEATPGRSRRRERNSRPYAEGAPGRSRRRSQDARPYVGGAPGRSRQRSPDARPYAQGAPARSRRRSPDARSYAQGSPARSRRRTPEARPYGAGSPARSRRGAPGAGMSRPPRAPGFGPRGRTRSGAPSRSPSGPYRDGRRPAASNGSRPRTQRPGAPPGMRGRRGRTPGEAGRRSGRTRRG
jgi:23S rRNA pseudouridine2605 synthase